MHFRVTILFRYSAASKVYHINFKCWWLRSSEVPECRWEKEPWSAVVLSYVPNYQKYIIGLYFWRFPMLYSSCHFCYPTLTSSTNRVKPYIVKYLVIYKHQLTKDQCSSAGPLCRNFSSDVTFNSKIKKGKYEIKITLQACIDSV